MIAAQVRRSRQTLDRGEFLRLAGVGAASVAVLGGVVGCGGQGPASGSLSFVSYGGSYQEAQTKAWLDPFSEQRGLRILQESPTDYAKLRAMVESRQVTWDVVDVANDFGLESSADLLEPIDYSVVNKKPILEGYADEYRVASMLYGNVLGYNTDQVEGTPQGWADFFDLEKFPGKRSLWKNPSETLEVASLGAGTPPEDLYPLDVEGALGKLDTIRDQIVWWDTGAQAQQQLADGEVAMASIWNSRIPVAVEEGAPLDTQWNQHVATAAYLVVPKGSPNKERAMEFISYITSAENNHRLANYIADAPINEKSISKVNPEMAPKLPTAHLEQGVPLDGNWWDENREKVTERFNEWLLA